MAGVGGRAQELTRELTSNPFFPLLFIGEATKTSAFWLVGEAAPEAVGISYGMAFLSVVAWLYTYEDVQWGICKTAETIEEATEEIAEEE